ncbi:hypothetical protein KA183_08615 [bacterium]|nr:hypothetical protein [bacterium]QQR56824.1 MAG: hypothetical protein IPG59_17760 [Candidatus Melainabacteria bacterium]
MKTKQVALINDFEYISFKKLSAMSLESEYLMNLSLTPKVLQDKHGIKFSKIDDSKNEYFAAIKAPNVHLFFEFRGGETSNVCVNVRGQNIDIREAYSIFDSLLNLRPSEIQWISDSV